MSRWVDGYAATLLSYSPFTSYTVWMDGCRERRHGHCWGDGLKGNGSDVLLSLLVSCVVVWCQCQIIDLIFFLVNLSGSAEAMAEPEGVDCRVRLHMPHGDHELFTSTPLLYLSPQTRQSQDGPADGSAAIDWYCTKTTGPASTVTKEGHDADDVDVKSVIFKLERFDWMWWRWRIGRCRVERWKFGGGRRRRSSFIFYAFCLRVALLFFKNSISLPPLFVRLVIYIFPFLLRDVFFK